MADGIRKETVPARCGFDEKTGITFALYVEDTTKAKAGGLMKIGLIGAGKVGCSMGKYFVEHGVCVSGYYSRNPESSKKAAAFTNTKHYEKLEDIIKESDTLFLTVPDGSIGAVYAEVIRSDIRGKVLAHCSGALSSSVFSGISLRGAYGYSIHPICAVNDKATGYQDLSKAYFTIEGDAKYLSKLMELFHSMGNPIEAIAPDKKVSYHAAAVFASNLVVSLYAQAARILEECGLGEEFAAHALLPLFMGNAEGIARKGAADALTGPVERGDLETVEKHLQALAGQEREIYRRLSLALIDVAKQKNPDRDYEALRDVLQEASADEG